MKSLIKNYVDLLSKEKLNEFAVKNDIILSDKEIEYLLNLVKTNFDDIIKDDTKYLDEMKNNINNEAYVKIKDLYIYYKNRYKGYLF